MLAAAVAVWQLDRDDQTNEQSSPLTVRGPISVCRQMICSMRGGVDQMLEKKVHKLGGTDETATKE